MRCEPETKATCTEVFCPERRIGVGRIGNLNFYDTHTPTPLLHLRVPVAAEAAAITAP